ncbi:LysR family transcriptional regulator [Microbacterium sp. 5K110]|jgi:DNA-binding transcriptional LysR family regulator|uniref:LysR family transcriptional regulator n=1 Tax=unclassified Microbacterium TaxID=2609290 RepID=UPI0010FDCEAB|nr:LysR family transcriptional regulator [Microbacterium sp. 5K110]TLF34708.1 LysR family transcriptional regulator [Microbacterium sp. 5K110]
MASVDLDLLRTFVAIYERRSLTLAAGVLNVTQPSVSYALGRLRRDLGDALFVRSSAGMEPTARAEQLYAVARPAIDGIDDVVAGRDFDPATARTRFRVALTDMGEFAYLPVLMERLARDAPGVSLDVVPVDVDAVDRWIASGEVDAAVSSAAPTGRTATVELFAETYVCVAQWPESLRGVPLAAEDLSPLRLALIDTSAGHDRVGRALDDAGVTPASVLRVHHFSTLPETLLRSKGAAIVPRRVAALFSARWPLSARPLGDLVEGFHVRLFANPALHPTGARRWFLAELEAAIRSFADGDDPGSDVLIG